MENPVKKKMGRPKLSPDESRSVQIHLRVTQEEKALIDATAEEMHCTVTQAIIKALRERKQA